MTIDTRKAAEAIAKHLAPGKSYTAEQVADGIRSAERDLTTDTAPLNAGELDAIEGRYLHTTEGTWTARGYNIFASEWGGWLIAGVKQDGQYMAFNAEFIAHAHQDIPALLTSHRALSARVESLENSRSCAIADHVAAEARATRAEALLSDLCRLTGAESHDAAVGTVATMLHGADAQAYGGVVRVYAEEREKRTQAEAERDDLRIENETLAATDAENQRLIDRIADMIGLPDDQELDAAGFERWFSASQAREAGMREALDDIHGMASAAIGPNCGAGPDLIRIAKRAGRVRHDRPRTA